MAETTDATENTKMRVHDPEAYRKGMEEWMRRQRPDVDDLQVVDFDIPQAGFSNETVVFSASWKEGGETKSQRYVARIESKGGSLFPEQASACGSSVEFQHRVMNAAGATGVAPVPPSLPFEGDASIIGRPFYVMEFVPGRIPTEVPRYSLEGYLVDEATPAERERMVLDGIKNMAELNKFDWKKADLDWLDPSGEGKPTMALQLQIYRDYTMRELAGREHPVMMRGLDWLDKNLIETPPGLTWGDARLGNMIWQDYKCVSILDWEAAALSPPEADIGWWVMFDRMSFDAMLAPRLEGFPTREEMVAYWEECTGRKVSDPLYWEIFSAMRFAAIFIRLGDRFVNLGLAPPDSGMPIKNLISDFLEDLLEKVGA